MESHMESHLRSKVRARISLRNLQNSDDYYTGKNGSHAEPFKIVEYLTRFSKIKQSILMDH